MQRIVSGIVLQDQHRRSLCSGRILLDRDGRRNPSKDFRQNNSIGSELLKGMLRDAQIPSNSESLYLLQKPTQAHLTVLAAYSAAFNFFPVTFSGARPLSSGLRYCPV